MITVVGCRLLVKPRSLVEHDEVYKRARAANITLLESSERKEQVNVDRGEVLQIGENADQDYVGTLKVGDIIGYAKFGGKYFKEDGQDYLVINDEDVICVFKETK